MGLISKQIQDDCKTILTTEQGRRFFGSIFYTAKLNKPGLCDEYHQGVRDCALMIANTIREIDPYGVAECEIAYADLLRRFKDGRTEYDDGAGTID